MYRHCDLLRGVPVSPGILEIEGAALYRRGQELAAKRDSDAFPDGVDAQEDVTGTLEAIINSALGRAGLPRLGYPKTARKEAVFCAAHQLLLLIFRQSWERQLPSLPFPIKTEINGNDVRLYLRQAEGVWQEERDLGSRRKIFGPIEKLLQLLQENVLATPSSQS